MSQDIEKGAVEEATASSVEQPGVNVTTASPDKPESPAAAPEQSAETRAATASAQSPGANAALEKNDTKEDTQEKPPPYTESDGAATVSVPIDEAPQVAVKDASATEAKPKTKQSVKEKIKAAKTKDTGLFSFFFEVISILISTICFTLCLALTMAIPLTILVIGAIYKDDCPRERYVPIYLIVSGCFGIAGILSNVIQRIIFKESPNRIQEDGKCRLNPIDCLVSTFLFAWFIAGNVWVYGIYGDFFKDPLVADKYCHPVLYYIAFWFITLTYVFFALSCCCCCFGVCCAKVFGKK